MSNPQRACRHGLPGDPFGPIATGAGGWPLAVLRKKRKEEGGTPPDVPWSATVA